MPEFTHYDVTVAAQSFANVASIIAGFAFIILVWLVDNLQRRQRDGQPTDGQTERALIFLAVTFMANLIDGLLWAVTSGEVNPEVSRPGVLNFLIGLNFTLAAPLMFEALVFFLASARVHRVIRIFREVFFASVVIGVAFQWISTRALLQTLDFSESVFDSNRGIFTVLLPLTLVVVAAGVALSTRRPARRFGLNAEASFGTFNTVWLGVILATTVGCGLVLSGGPDATLPKVVIWVGNLVWAGVLGWSMAFLPLREAAA